MSLEEDVRLLSAEIRMLRLSIDRLTVVMGARASVPVPAPTLEILVDDLDLSVRALNVLAHKGVKTIGDLIALTRIDLLKLPHCGKRTIREYEKALATYGLKIKGEP